MPSNRMKTPPRKNKKNSSNNCNSIYQIFGILLAFFLIIFLFQYFFELDFSNLINDFQFDNKWVDYEFDLMDL